LPPHGQVLRAGVDRDLLGALMIGEQPGEVGDRRRAGPGTDDRAREAVVAGAGNRAALLELALDIPARVWLFALVAQLLPELPAVGRQFVLPLASWR
jgi:hypothetical protein